MAEDRGVTEYHNWCRGLFHALADGGKWGVPRSGLTFTRKGDKFVLTDRAAYFEGLAWIIYQQSDYLVIKEEFEAAGIPVSDETDTSGIPIIDKTDEEAR